jgi:predicted ATPase/class 3 adenylate cyclase
MANPKGRTVRFALIRLQGCPGSGGGGTLAPMAGPSGTVTFLFTDIEGSTRLWQEDETAMREAVARHDRLLGDAISDYGGVVFSTTGDGLAVAFQTASAALCCGVEAQRRLSQQRWGTVRPVRVRVGLHTGEAEMREGDYFGTAVNRAARLVAVAHGGQLICSSATAELVDTDLVVVDLGEHRLRDLDRPMHVFQIGEGSFPPLRSLSAFPGNLPIQLTSFVGRQEELAVVARALEVSRLVTLTGTGGVGKTRLAVQAAAQRVTDFPDGVWLCELAAAVDAESMFQVVAAGVDYMPAPGVDLERGIPRFVGSRRMLVLLDNCEHLLDPAAVLAETILERCPNLVVLATSREPLEVGGERVIRVHSLPVPRAGASLEHLAEFEAARLFLDRAEATGAELTLEAADGPAIAEISRRLDGIPLAIELAAARVIALGPGEIAARLDERFRLLSGGRRAALERHHTLRAAIDWSYALLSQRDQLVFDRLGVFPASFDASAAQAVAAAGGIEPWDVLDALTSLVGKSMLNADRAAATPTRYQMLESLRHYARERLEAAGAADETRRGHARHYGLAVAEICGGLRGPDEVLWRRRLDVEVENFRAAVMWALDSDHQEDGELAMVILGELVSPSAVSNSVNGGVDDQLDDRALERTRRGVSRYGSLVIVGAALKAFHRGNLPHARDLFDEAMQGVRGSPYPGVVLAARLAFIDPPSLAAELAEALQILDQVGADTSDYAQVHAVAAVMAALLENLSLARQEAAVAVESSRSIGNPSLLAQGLYASVLASWQSDPGAARTALEEHLEIIRHTGTGYMLPRSLALLAQLRAGAGDLPGALQALEEGVDRAHRNSDRPSTAACLARGAAVMAALGDHHTAAVILGALTNEVRARRSGVSANEIPDYNQFVTTLRSQLGHDRYNDATARGAAMSYEQASAFALAAIEGLRPK